MSNEYDLMLDADVIFDFDLEKTFRHICACLKGIQKSSIIVREDGSIEILLKLKTYAPKGEVLRSLCTKLANKILSRPEDTVNAFTDLFIRWRYCSDLCDYARLYDGRFKSRTQANKFAIKFTYTLFKGGLIRVSNPLFLANIVRKTPSKVSVRNVCIFKDGKRTGSGESIKLSVNLKRLAEEGFYEVMVTDAIISIIKKEKGLSLTVESPHTPKQKIDFGEQHGKIILDTISPILKPIYKPKIRLKQIKQKGGKIRIGDERLISPKAWKFTKVDGEEIYVEEGTTYLPKVEEIRNFRSFLQELVRIMGGNPETINVCVADRRTDGYNTKGQLFFNITRKEDPYRWLIVTARELAYNISRKRYPHMNAMTDLLVNTIKRWHEVEEIYKKLSTESSKEVTYP